MDELKASDSENAQRLRQSLSALADGEASGNDISSACAAWREDARTRADWHAYALIGDVLRSDDLAQSAEHDQAFLAGLRQRMAAEPVVLAPTAPAAQVVGGRRHWNTSMAVAAGALAVMGVAAVVRGVSVSEVSGPVALVQSAPAPTAKQAAQTAEALVAVNALAAASGADGNTTYVHDAEIDRYLNAHRQYARGSVMATPGGLRQVATSPSGR